jgi:hypothetical protein
MQSSGCSEKNQNNNLKAIIAFANFIGADVSFYDIHRNKMTYKINTVNLPRVNSQTGGKISRSPWVTLAILSHVCRYDDTSSYSGYYQGF